MTLDLPDGAHIHILVAPAPIAPAWAAARSPDLSAAVGLPPAATPAPRPRRRLFKGTAVLALIVGAYLVGEHAHPGQALTAAQAQYRTQVAAPAPSPSRDMPQAFRQQLQAPPIVTPAPGSPAPASRPGEDGFGMEN